jgi:hypothetical protein
LSQRWRRLARETVAAIQKIEEKVEESVSQCMQVSNYDKLKQAQVLPGTLCFSLIDPQNHSWCCRKVCAACCKADEYISECRKCSSVC